MAVCRVYLFTYERNEMLKRAVTSLLKQTVTDWVCEVHNDKPGDKFPSTYINSLSDSRFIMKDHAENLGTTRSFNLAFSSCAEKYASMLEDDNWWEPTFLAEMIQVMDANADLAIAWCNMHIWQENEDNSWTDTGTSIWPAQKDTFFTWPQPVEALGCLHSTGAMLYRGDRAKNYKLPDVALSNSVELLRERCFEFPLFLYAKELANFSRTLITSQTKGPVKWTGTQVMMLASFLKGSSNINLEFKKLLEFYKKQKPSPVPVFYLANHFYLKQTKLLKNFKASDWMIITRWWIKNVFNAVKIKTYLQEQKETWEYLEKQTKPFVTSQSANNT